MIDNETDQLYLPSNLAFLGDDVEIYPPVLFLNPGNIEIGHNTRIDSFTRIEGGNGVKIGHHTHISSFSSIYAGGQAIIGDYVGIAQGARIITGAGFPFEKDFPVVFPMSDPYYRSADRVIIKDYAIIASNSVVLPGVVVGEGAVVAAGSVATDDVPAWTVVAGVPARWTRVRAKPR